MQETKDYAVEIIENLGKSRANQRYVSYSDKKAHVYSPYGKEILENTVWVVAQVLDNYMGRRLALKVIAQHANAHELAERLMVYVVNNMMEEVPRFSYEDRLAANIGEFIEHKIISKNSEGWMNYVKMYKRHWKLHALKGISKKAKQDLRYGSVVPNSFSYRCLARTFTDILMAMPDAPVYFKMRKRYDGKKQINVCLKDGVKEWMREKRNEAHKLNAWYTPRTTPPLDWTSIYEGGFSDLGFACKFMRSNETASEYDLIKPWEHMEPAAKAANVLQQVQHEVDGWTFDLLYSMYEQQVKFAGFPQWEDVPRKDYTPQEWDEYGKIEVFKMRDINSKNAGKRNSLAGTISVTKMFKHHAPLYLPMKADYRGRLYTLNKSPSYQGEDYNKAMLRFHAASKTNDTADHWLRRQVANLWGWDKKTIYERLTFVDEYDKQLHEWVADPEHYFREWGEADEPWQFIAAAKEWVEYKKNPATHEHKLPIGMDASNNGLQILSVIARDAEGCVNTNVLPSDRPQDFYTRVKDALFDELIATDGRGQDMAQKWLTLGIDRSMVKKPVMTLPYGGTYHATSNHVAAWAIDKQALGEHVFGMKEINKAASWLTKRLRAHIYAQMPEVQGVIDWLTQTAMAGLDASGELHWRSPSGVVVDPREYRIGERIHLELCGGVRTGVKGVGRDLNKRRMKSGFVPNFVHSIDAAVVHTVAQRLPKGVPLSTVHDCYNTTAPHAEQVHRIVVDSFVDVMESGIAERLVEDMTALGAKGLKVYNANKSLDLSEARKSVYMFS